MLINQDLYNQIIRNNANKFSNLRVITGYSSAKFLALVQNGQASLP